MVALSVLAKIAKEAGDVVLAMQAEVVANENGEQEVKYDGSIVTTADKKAHEIVCNRLNEYFPTVAVVSEEAKDEDNNRALQKTERFETDPLDNTSGYAKGRDGFSVNIGLIRDGVPVDGVIYFPARKELYFVGEDGKAYLQEGDSPPRQINVRDVPTKNEPLKIAVGFNEQIIPNIGDRTYEETKLPAQLRTCMVARGECDLTGINKGEGGGFNSWDTAGPHAVLIAAGGEMVDTKGQPVRYPINNIKLPDHILGSTKTLIETGLGNATSIASAVTALKSARSIAPKSTITEIQ